MATPKIKQEYKKLKLSKDEKVEINSGPRGGTPRSIRLKLTTNQKKEDGWLRLSGFISPEAKEVINKTQKELGVSINRAIEHLIFKSQ